MSASDLAAINALDKAALNLQSKGHFARAAEKRGAAVAAAQALGHADCLITATLQLEEADTWVNHADAPGVTSADAGAAIVRALHLLDAVIPTLERRMAASTLLAGACRPLEEAWSAARWKLAMGLEDALEGEWQAQFVGYEAYLVAAPVALRVALVPALGAPELAQRLVAFVVSALDLMAQPRSHNKHALHTEVDLFRTLQHSRYIKASEPFPVLHAMLGDAWIRLQSSGVLRERCIDVVADAIAVQSAARIAANGARITSAVLRGCALEACAAREVHPAQFKKCGACQAVVYCCKAHQEQHWPAHKAACKAARKAAAEGGAGPSSGGA
jgi:hypothetical protein